MNIEYLRELVALECYGSFSAASRALFTSQPNLSHHVAAMEKELGFDLLSRESGKTVAFTYEGTVMLAAAKEVVSHYDAATKRCRRLVGIPDQRITIALPLYYDSFPPLLRDAHEALVKHLNQRFEKLSIHVVHLGVADSLEELLRTGEADIGYGPGASNKQTHTMAPLTSGLAFIPLANDTIVASCAADHPLAQWGEAPLNLHDLSRFVITFANSPSSDALRHAIEACCSIEGVEVIFKPSSQKESYAAWCDSQPGQLMLAPRPFAEFGARALGRPASFVEVSLVNAQFHVGLLYQRTPANPITQEAVEFAATWAHGHNVGW